MSNVKHRGLLSNINHQDPDSTSQLLSTHLLIPDVKADVRTKVHLRAFQLGTIQSNQFNCTSCWCCCSPLLEELQGRFPFLATAGFVPQRSDWMSNVNLIFVNFFICWLDSRRHLLSIFVKRCSIPRSRFTYNWIKSRSPSPQLSQLCGKGGSSTLSATYSIWWKNSSWWYVFWFGKELITDTYWYQIFNGSW